MTGIEPSIRINVDVTNPGQFFACCGLLELADRLWQGAEGCFDGRQFCIGPVPCDMAIKEMLTSLIECKVDPQDDDSKTSPLQLGSPIHMRLDWWIGGDGKPNLFKTWAANATSQQMFSKWREPLKGKLAIFAAQPERILTVSDRIQGSYGFDSDLGWNALNIGFSLNEHADLKQLPTRPAVELFGAIGLQRFFPILDRSNQVVQYSNWHVPLGASVAGAAAAGKVAGVAVESFRTRFVYRGSFKWLERAISMQGATNE